MFAIITEYQAGASAEERGEGHQKEKREMTGVRSLLFAGSHRSSFEENGSLEPTLCQGVAVPSAFIVFSPGGRVLPRTLSYLLSTPLF